MSALLLIALLSPVEEKTISFRQLERLAVDAYKDKGKWFVIIPPEYSGEKMVNVNRGYVWASDPVKDHKYQPIVIELIRLEMWENHRPPFTTARENERVLSDCRKLIHDYFKALDKRNNKQHITTKAIEDEYEKGLVSIAKQKGITFNINNLTFGFLVDIETDPPGARVHMMSVLNWSILEKEGKNPKEEIKKTVMTQTQGVELIGHYYYYLEWPDQKKQPVGPFKTPITGKGKLVLK